MDRDLAGILISIIILFAALLPLAFYIDKMECKAKANAIGYKCEYGILQGCILEKPNGKKVLLQQLRDIGE
jgi:hypothetical protein